MKKQITFAFLIILVTFSLSSCLAQTNITIGDRYYYTTTARSTFTYNGETIKRTDNLNKYLEVVDIVDDLVYLYWSQYGKSGYTLTIYGEDNYNPFNLNYPGYFVNISDLDFLYSVWPDRWVSEEVIECTASNRRFYTAEYNASYSYTYGYNSTTYYGFGLEDSGEYSYSFEISYNENGVRDYFKEESSFKGAIAEDHYLLEEKLTNVGNITVSYSYYSILLSLLIIPITREFIRRRRFKK